MEKIDLDTAVELHDIEGIRAALSEIDLKGREVEKPLLLLLIGEYTRSPRFKSCVKIFLEAGHGLKDPTLEAVLLDDVDLLMKGIQKNPESLHQKYSLPCAYSPFHEVTLLHICAEFNHHLSAKTLVNLGLDINVQAGVDEYGFGGQTPIFHTVNQNSNQSKEMLDFCLEHGADLDLTVRGLLWGKGYDWETFIPAVNPISYTMMGLLPQMHRKEETVSTTVSKLMKHSFGLDYRPSNIPNKYLKS
jgi:hypothetical protein